MTARRFLPADKPKSWTLSLIFILFAPVVLAPMSFAADALGWRALAWVLAKAMVGFLGLGFVSFAAFLVRGFLGHYVNLTAKPWRDQVW